MFNSDVPSRFPSSMKSSLTRLDSGFTTEISAWLALAAEGGEIGDDSGSVGRRLVRWFRRCLCWPVHLEWDKPDGPLYTALYHCLAPPAVTTTTTITYPPITTTLVEFGGSDDDNPTTVSTTIIFPPDKFQHLAMFFFVRSLTNAAWSSSHHYCHRLLEH